MQAARVITLLTQIGRSTVKIRVSFRGVGEHGDCMELRALHTLLDARVEIFL